MRPNYQRSKNAIIALYIVLAASVLVLLTELYTLLILTDSVSLGIGGYDTYVMIVGASAVIYFGAWIACAITFIQWFRRAYFNLHKLIPSSKLRYTEGWAAGAWFIPIFSLFGPYQIATDLFTNSEGLLVGNNLMERKPGLHRIAGWWWGLWVTQTILANISTRMDGAVDIATVGTVLGIIGSFAAIGAAYLGVQMIKNYSPMEELLKQVPYKDGLMPEMSITNDDLLDSGI
jgi:hypothetical protein